jgi:hypothetical protein
MAHNEDNYLVDDDDQHVQPWKPRSPSQIFSFSLDQLRSSHLVNTVCGRQ